MTPSLPSSSGNAAPFKAPALGVCPIKWEEMAGSDTTRFCEHCTLHVHDLSAIPRQDAEAMLAGRERRGDRLCVTYLADKEGNLVTSLPPKGATATASTASRAGGVSRWSLSALMAGFAAGIASLLTGCVPMSTPPAGTGAGSNTTGFATPPPAVKNRDRDSDYDYPPPPPQPSTPPTKVLRTVGMISPAPQKK